MQLPYSSKATAVRGAKRSGIENPRVEQREDGKWYILGGELPPGEYTATVTGVTVNENTNVITMTAEVAGLGEIKSTIQPVLSPETAAKAEQVIAMAEADLVKLAATLPQPVTSTPEEIAARREERRQRIQAQKEEAANKPKVPSYKELLRAAPTKSQIDKPVAFVHAYLATHYGTKPRKAIIADLVAFGLNIAMCRSQYQIYRKKNGLTE